MLFRSRRASSSLGSPFVLGGGILLSFMGAAFVVRSLESDHPAVQVLGTAAGVGLLTLSAVFVKFFVDGKQREGAFSHVLGHPIHRRTRWIRRIEGDEHRVARGKIDRVRLECGRALERDALFRREIGRS